MIKKVRQPVGDSCLEIENIGPIAGPVRVPFDRSGDLVEIIGPNGSGKTTLLNAIAAAFGKGNKLQRRDGVKTPGYFAGLGRTIEVSKRMQMDGDLKVPTLDEEYSINDVVNPRIQQPDKADAAILRTILRLAQAPADPVLFHELFTTQEEFNKIVDPESLKTDDVVQMARNIKRDIDRAALAVERQGDSHSTEALALEKSLEGIDLTAVPNLEEIKAQYETAVRDSGTLEAGRKAYLAAVTKATELRIELEEAEAAAGTPMAELEGEVARLTTLVDEHSSMLQKIDKQIEELQKQRNQTFNDMELAVQKTATAQARVIAAKESASKLETLRASLAEAEAVPEVTQEIITECSAQVETLRQRMTDAELLNRSTDKVKRRDDEKRKAEVCRKEGERLRDAAKGTDAVLSDLIGKVGTSIYVGSDDKDNIRLMTKHPVRGEIYFLELSKGERTMLVLSLQIKAVGEGGFFDVDQEPWEGLDPENRAKFYSELKANNVVAFVAQCADGELRSRSWSLDKVAEPVAV